MHDLFFSSGTGHSMMVLAFVIGIGLLLGKLKVKGVSFGAAWILVVGILFSALGIKTDPLFLHFIKEFGLILFVFAIGLQVGPAFFNSFRKESLKLNLLSVMMILLCVLCVVIIYAATEIDLPSLVGSMTGAMTNTPGLGTAQQTYYDTSFGTFLAEVDYPDVAERIASAFAIAYPIGILGIILVLVFLRRVFRIDFQKERTRTDLDPSRVVTRVFEVTNPAIFGRRLAEVCSKFEGDYVTSVVFRDGTQLAASSDPQLQEGDRVQIDLQTGEVHLMTLVFGKENVETEELPAGETASVSGTRLIVTNRQLNGKKLRDLKVLERFGVTLTRIVRSGVELVAREDLYLQLGDTLKVIGEKENVERFAAFVGNSEVDLERPNLIPVFLGIGIALIAGAIPFHFSALPYAVHLGIAGGTLLVAILLGHFGPKWKITTYTTASANRMLREIGLSLLLATIGLSAGSGFVEAFLDDGLSWVLFAALISIVPSLLTGLIARLVFRLDFEDICGLICGATTNSPVLSFVQERFGTDHAAISFASVYPLAMFLQVLLAQLVILFS